MDLKAENKIKLKRDTCYCLMVRGFFEYFLESYKGYSFTLNNIKFDICNSKFGWQINWQGMMIKHYGKLKELKAEILKDNNFINLLEQIKQGKIQPNPRYIKLIKELEAKDE